MSPYAKLRMNGRELRFAEGETVLEVARRHQVPIPTLCHDPRLEPAGACRSCLVEIDGSRRMLPACATPAKSEMVVTTESARIERHRKSLLALYLCDHPTTLEEAEKGAPNQLLAMAERYDAPRDWGQLENLREGRPGDRNPYIHFDPNSCIACARCVRYCEEVEGVSAITLAGRGSRTTIATADMRSLMDSSCELCGGCIDTCPTGAMGEKMPLEAGDKAERELKKVRTTCNFCGVGCQLDLNVDPAGRGGQGKIVKITSPEPGTTMNDGNTCVKGRFAYDFIHSEERLQTPMVRDDQGDLIPASWEEAIDRAAQGLLRVKEKHGADALAFVSSSRCTVEENYLVQKLARAAFGTNNCHQCAAT